MDLIIVESPSKAKTINKYLKGKYRVDASAGHIRDLPMHTLGVDVKNNFEPKYVNSEGKEDVIRCFFLLMAIWSILYEYH